MKSTLPDRWFILTVGATALLAGAGFGARIGGVAGAVVGAIAGGAVGYLLDWPQRRRFARRRALLSAAFPPSWQRSLENRFPLYSRFPHDLRRSFENDVRLFVGEQRITGVGIEATEELKLLVAASAVTLSLGWPEYEWSQLAEVLLYPDDFDRDYVIGRREIAGQAHPWGTVILSVPSLLRSFDVPHDGHHVGFHEFAHMLDKEGVHFDGIPPGLGSSRAEAWVELERREMKRILDGNSLLDPYGATNPQEFLAVAVATFFERSHELRERHPTLYEALASYFGQDPATWNESDAGPPGRLA